MNVFVLSISFVIMLVNDSNVLIQSEDRSSQQKRLRHVIQQPTRYVINHDYLIRHQCDTAHDEQHRTGVLRDLEAFLVFHGVDVLHHGSTCSTQKQGDDVTDHLKDLLNCFAHNFSVLNGE